MYYTFVKIGYTDTKQFFSQKLFIVFRSFPLDLETIDIFDEICL